MKNVLEYLENSVQRYPEKIAYSTREEKITFELLSKKSRALANRIKAETDIFNKPVGVIADRNFNTVIYFFSVLYSGNYYVPIDPDMPKAKIQSIIDDADISIILGDEAAKDFVENLEFSGKYLSVNDCGDGECSIPEIEENAPCYMVYTSGSTGKPKGVVKSHKAVISFVEAYISTFDFSFDDIVGNQTPFFFDASAKDIYLALKMAMTIEILPTELFAMPPMLIEYMNERRISFISWVPTALSIVSKIRTFSYILPQTLKKVFFVGEVMPMKHLNYWRKYLPDLQYVNLYGQSELAGICCYYDVKKEFENTETLPMGKPLSNCKIYLLSEDQSVITEAEKSGEMYVVSESLANEYFNDAEKTERCFIYKDFGEGNVRCFKTGDMAKYDSEGNFIFCTRTDFQIKHMGRRIELGEIETIAGALEEIARCACIYDSEKSKIIMFAELSDGFDFTGQEIKSKLKEVLSSYMLPSVVNIVEKMPLNPNGKINRTLLKELK